MRQLSTVSGSFRGLETTAPFGVSAGDGVAPTHDHAAARYRRNGHVSALQDGPVLHYREETSKGEDKGGQDLRDDECHDDKGQLKVVGEHDTEDSEADAG